jgi:hypothetical protein
VHELLELQATQQQNPTDSIDGNNWVLNKQSVLLYHECVFLLLSNFLTVSFRQWDVPRPWYPGLLSGLIESLQAGRLQNIYSLGHQITLTFSCPQPKHPKQAFVV